MQGVLGVMCLGSLWGNTLGFPECRARAARECVGMGQGMGDLHGEASRQASAPELHLAAMPRRRLPPSAELRGRGRCQGSAEPPAHPVRSAAGSP